MLFRFDQLGKNILRDFFGLLADAQTEVEVPPGDAQRIDLWLVPDPVRLKAHPEIPAGLLRSMAEQPAMVELWSQSPDVTDFHACMRKRYQWHHTLERRAETSLPLPTLWLVSAGRPEGLMRDFGLAPGQGAPEGLYVTAAPGLRVRLVVIAELPRARETLLLRLLGSARVRRVALRDLAGLPADAWERQVALPWLVRLSFEVPAEMRTALPVEEREFIMETREWFERFQAERLQQAVQQAEERGQLRGEIRSMARFCGKRLGRALSETETAALASLLARVGEDRVEQAVLSFSAEALSAWLADPEAQ